MAREEAVYIGLRGLQPAFGHEARPSSACASTCSRALRKHPHAQTLPDEFEWGYQGAGPGVLAEAILADPLGFNPDPPVSTALAREVVGRLESEFELPGRELEDWLARRPPAVAREAADRAS